MGMNTGIKLRKDVRSILISALFILMISLPDWTFGQARFSDNLKISGNYHFGVNLPEYDFFTYLTEDFVQSADLCIVKETSGKNIWEDLYNYPEHGMSLFYTTLGNNAVYGQELSLNYFFKLNAIRTNRFKLYNRLGFGLGYVNRKFDAQSNYLNVAIGSHFNIHFNARLGAEFIINKKLEAGFGISFDHLSNANTSATNLGINTTTLFAGMSYMLRERTEKVKVEKTKHKPSNKLEIVSLIGGKVIRNSSFVSSYYGVFGISVEGFRDIFRGFHIGVGTDIFYDTSIKTSLTSIGEPYQGFMSWQTGIHVSQSIVYNRFSVTIQEGFYVGLRNHIYDKVMYNRGIIKYRITDHFTVRLTMKSHLHILDFPEFGFGYRF